MKELIIKYLNGEATFEEKQQMLSWLKEDKENKKIFSEIRDIWIASVSSAISDQEVRNAFSRFKQNINLREYRNTGYGRITFLHIAASVVILIVCTLGGYFVGKQSFSGGSTENVLVMNQVVMGNEVRGLLRYLTVPQSG